MCGYTPSSGFTGNIEIDIVIILCMGILIRHTSVQGHNSPGSLSLSATAVIIMA